MADLELSGLTGEPFTITLPGYTFTLPNDTPLSLLIGASKALSLLGNAATGEKDVAFADIEKAEAEVWKIVEAVMRSADPPPAGPAREIMSTTDAIRLVTFLASQFQAGTNSTTFSPSPISTGEQSHSVNSLPPEFSTAAPSG